MKKNYLRIVLMVFVLFIIGVSFYSVSRTRIKADVSVVTGTVYGRISGQSGNGLEGILTVILPGDVRTIKTTPTGAFVIEKVGVPNFAQFSFRDMQNREYFADSFEKPNFYLSNNQKLDLKGWRR